MIKGLPGSVDLRFVFLPVHPYIIYSIVIRQKRLKILRRLYVIGSKQRVGQFLGAPPVSGTEEPTEDWKSGSGQGDPIGLSQPICGASQSRSCRGGKNSGQRQGRSGVLLQSAVVF